MRFVETMPVFLTQTISRRQKNAERCIKDFTSAKMEFASAISKKLYFSNIQLKGVVNRLSSFQNLSDHANRFLMG